MRISSDGGKAGSDLGLEGQDFSRGGKAADDIHFQAFEKINLRAALMPISATIPAIAPCSRFSASAMAEAAGMASRQEISGMLSCPSTVSA